MEEEKAKMRMEEGLAALASGIDEAIEQLMGERLGFILVMFHEEKDGSHKANYIGNINRLDGIEAMEDTAKDLRKKLKSEASPAQDIH